MVTYRGAQKSYDPVSENYDICFTATIDTLDADSVGFVFSKTQETPTKENVPNEQVKSTMTVHTSLTSAGSTITAESLGGNYIFACTVTEIPEGEINIPLYVRAFSTVGTETTYTPVATVTVNSLP